MEQALKKKIEKAVWIIDGNGEVAHPEWKYFHPQSFTKTWTENGIELELKALWGDNVPCTFKIGYNRWGQRHGLPIINGEAYYGYRNEKGELCLARHYWTNVDSDSVVEAIIEALAK